MPKLRSDDGPSVILRQSTAVAIGGRALLIEGPPGAGKSSLALSLIDRGAQLIGDDGIALELREDRLWALPAPATRGLIELRGIGIATMTASVAPVALILELDREAPRFVEVVGRLELAGARIPHLPFDPDNPAAAIRAEHALALHGLE